MILIFWLAEPKLALASEGPCRGISHLKSIPRTDFSASGRPD